MKITISGESKPREVSFGNICSIDDHFELPIDCFQFLCLAKSRALIPFVLDGAIRSNLLYNVSSNDENGLENHFTLSRRMTRDAYDWECALSEEIDKAGRKDIGPFTKFAPDLKKEDITPTGFELLFEHDRVDARGVQGVYTLFVDANVNLDGHEIGVTQSSQFTNDMDLGRLLGRNATN